MCFHTSVIYKFFSQLFDPRGITFMRNHRVLSFTLIARHTRGLSVSAFCVGSIWTHRLLTFKSLISPATQAPPPCQPSLSHSPGRRSSHFYFSEYLWWQISHTLQDGSMPSLAAITHYCGRDLCMRYSAPSWSSIPQAHIFWTMPPPQTFWLAFLNFSYWSLKLFK